MSTPEPTLIIDPAQAAADAAAQQAIATQQAADQAAAQAAQAQADAQAELERQQAVSTPAAPVTLVTTVATDVAVIIPEVLAAINDPAGLKKSAIAILTAIVGVLVSVGLIPSATDTAIVSAASILLPAVFMVVTAIHGHATSNVQAAAIRAKA